MAWNAVLSHMKSHCVSKELPQHPYFLPHPFHNQFMPTSHLHIFYLKYFQVGMAWNAVLSHMKSHSVSKELPQHLNFLPRPFHNQFMPTSHLHIFYLKRFQVCIAWNAVLSQMKLHCVSKELPQHLNFLPHPFHNQFMPTNHLHVFFLKYFQACIAWNAVLSHMKLHCVSKELPQHLNFLPHPFHNQFMPTSHLHIFYLKYFQVGMA